MCTHSTDACQSMTCTVQSNPCLQPADRACCVRTPPMPASRVPACPEPVAVEPSECSICNQADWVGMHANRQNCLHSQPPLPTPDLPHGMKAPGLDVPWLCKWLARGQTPEHNQANPLVNLPGEQPRGRLRGPSPSLWPSWAGLALWHRLPWLTKRLPYHAALLTLCPGPPCPWKAMAAPCHAAAARRRQPPSPPTQPACFLSFPAILVP